MAGVLMQGRDIHVAVGGTELLHGVNFDLRRGEILGLLGPNGAGKSTLLKALAGVLERKTGEIILDGTEISQIAPIQRARRVAYLPQDATVHWPLTAANVVSLGRLPYRSQKRGAADAEAVRKALRRTEMFDLRHRTMDTLSGGERMRVLVARMLAVEADLLLADEPVSGLDPYYQLEFMDLFAEEAQRGGAVMLVLHDLALAARYCDRLLMLDKGRVVSMGAPEEILTDPSLQSVFGIVPIRGVHDGRTYVLPWSRAT